MLFEVRSTSHHFAIKVIQVMMIGRVARSSIRNTGRRLCVSTLKSNKFTPISINKSTTINNVTFHRFHSSNTNQNNTLKVDDPQLMIAFTCKKCDTRSSHQFSKQSYHKGTVLIQCPGCSNRHLIADNLNLFNPEKFNLEDVLRAKGELVATTTEDLAFEDIPESLRDTIGHHAKDAPDEYVKRTEGGGLPGRE